MTFKLIIAGTRSFNNYKALEKVIDTMLRNKVEHEPDIIIVSGANPGCEDKKSKEWLEGADRLGEKYGKSRKFTVEKYPADWTTYGKAAGPIRNAKMSETADALCAFWDEKSRGTKNMIELMKARNKPYRVFNMRGKLIEWAN